MKRGLTYFILIGSIIWWNTACKHAPILDDDVIIIDTTTTVIDTITNPPDTMNLMPCDPDVIYFEVDILPILISNCAFSGCHDAESAQDGVILTDYESVMLTADVEPFDLQHSEIYEVLVEDDEDKRMPPAPEERLNPEQIQQIAKWILQGGENLKCDPDADACEDTDMSFSEDIQPILALHCEGCHGGTVPSGGISLETYDGVKTVADSGALLGVIMHETGYPAMPKGGQKLTDCLISKVESWINDGALNN